MSTVDSAEKLLPAYVSYGTFKNFIRSLKTDGLPGRIDKSTMSNLAGGTQSHLTSTLKFLELIGEGGEPDPALELLVEAGDENWSAALSRIIEAAYSPILGQLELRSATAGQLTEVFSKAGLNGTTLDKALRFYLHAIKDAKIEHSAQVARMKVKSSTPKKPKSKPAGTSPANSTEAKTRSVAADDENEDQEDERDVPGMISFPIHIRGKKTGRIVVPEDIDPDDCKMIELASQAVKLYAEQS